MMFLNTLYRSRLRYFPNKKKFLIKRRRVKVRYCPYIHAGFWRVLPAVRAVRMFYHIFRNQKVSVPYEILCDCLMLSRQQKRGNKNRIYTASRLNATWHAHGDVKDWKRTSCTVHIDTVWPAGTDTRAAVVPSAGERPCDTADSAMTSFPLEVDSWQLELDYFQDHWRHFLRHW